MIITVPSARKPIAAILLNRGSSSTRISKRTVPPVFSAASPTRSENGRFMPSVLPSDCSNKISSTYSALMPRLWVRRRNRQSSPRPFTQESLPDPLQPRKGRMLVESTPCSASVANETGVLKGGPFRHTATTPSCLVALRWRLFCVLDELMFRCRVTVLASIMSRRWPCPRSQPLNQGGGLFAAVVNG